MRLTVPFDMARRRRLVERDRTRDAVATRAFRVLGWLILSAATLWLYLPSVRGELVWDDLARIGVPSASGHAPWFRDVLPRDLGLGAGPERYRPLTQLSLRADLKRAAGDSAAFHWTSILLHLFNVLLVNMLARRLRLTRGASWFAALLFAVYPLGTLAVGHVGGREEVLALTFLLMAFLLHASRRWIYEPVAVLMFTLALLARPAAAGGGLVMIAWELKRGRPLREALARLAPYAVVGAVVLFAVRRHFGTLGFMSGMEGDPRALLRTVPVAFYRLFQVMLRPYAVSEPSVLNFRGENLVPWVAASWEPRLLAGLAFTLAYGAAVWLTVRGRGRALVPMVALPVLWLPLDSIFFGRAFDLTHNLYAPSVAFVLLMALMVERAGFEGRAGGVRRALVAAAAALVALSFVVATQARLGVWHDEGTVYLEAMNRYPSVAAYHAGYGTWLARKGDDLPAVDELRRAVEMDPTLAAAHYNLGLLHASLARDGEAASSFERAAALDPRDPDALLGLARACLRLDRPAEALASAQRAVALDGSRADLHEALGMARMERGDLSEAELEVERAIQLEPRGARHHAALAAVLRRARRLEESLVVATNAVRLDGRSPEAALERARTLDALGRRGEALEDLNRYQALVQYPDPAALRLLESLKQKLGR